MSEDSRRRRADESIEMQQHRGGANFVKAFSDPTVNKVGFEKPRRSARGVSRYDHKRLTRTCNGNELRLHVRAKPRHNDDQRWSRAKTVIRLQALLHRHEPAGQCFSERKQTLEGPRGVSQPSRKFSHEQQPLQHPRLQRHNSNGQAK